MCRGYIATINSSTIDNRNRDWKRMYHIAEKFGEFGESSVIRQTKTIQISTYN